MTDERTLTRFWSRVTKTDDCWLWAGHLVHGYGALWLHDEKRTVRVHRFAYELLVGPIPAGLQLDHLCRVRNCVNPAHLEPVTGKVNTLRGTSFSAVNASKTHCKRGHEFTEENTYRVKNGRECLTCKRLLEERRWAMRGVPQPRTTTGRFAKKARAALTGTED